MNPSILILTEEEQGHLRKVSREALGLGRTLADAHGLRVVAAVFGQAKEHAEEALVFGADEAVCLTPCDQGTCSGEVLSMLAKEAVQRYTPVLVVTGASSQGRELAARLAADLSAALAQDAMDCTMDNATFTITRPMYGGRVVATVRLHGDLNVVSIRPNAFGEAKRQAAPIENISTLEVETPSAGLKVVDTVAQQDHVDISEADVIISGGYGAGAEGFDAISALAGKLQGAVGASRAAVDAGWRPVQEQVGQTGKVVSPKLYVACGISGAIQHVTGISTAKIVVAINKDPQAPIFAKADLGVVGDLHEIVPLLTEALEGM